MRELESRSGVSRGSLSQIERGVRVPSDSERGRVAAAFGLPVSATRVQLVLLLDGVA